MNEVPAIQLLMKTTALARELWQGHAPNINNAKKLALFEAAGGRERVPEGELRIARYMAGALMDAAPAHDVAVESVVSVYTYAAPPAGTRAWHVNFADPYLFAFYGTAAFAQDEIQVAEHPLLASVRELLLAGEAPGWTPRTVDEHGITPVLVRDVERWSAIDLSPQRAHPDGIYGRKLQKASDDVLREAVTRLPPGGPRSNILAIAAPTGAGFYTEEQVRTVLEAASAGFFAARLESDPKERVVIHTGHWGTGAFGGNRELMAIGQIFAARLARIDTLVYHSLDERAAASLAAGRAFVRERLDGVNTTRAAIDAIMERRFAWGSSDGN